MELPVELWDKISQYLYHFDRVAFRRTCSTFRDLVDSRMKMEGLLRQQILVALEFHRFKLFQSTFLLWYEKLTQHRCYTSASDFIQHLYKRIIELDNIELYDHLVGYIKLYIPITNYEICEGIIFASKHNLSILPALLEPKRKFYPNEDYTWQIKLGIAKSLNWERIRTIGPLKQDEEDIILAILVSSGNMNLLDQFLSMMGRGREYLGQNNGYYYGHPLCYAACKTGDYSLLKLTHLDLSCYGTLFMETGNTSWLDPIVKKYNKYQEDHTQGDIFYIAHVVGELASDLGIKHKLELVQLLWGHFPTLRYSILYNGAKGILKNFHPHTLDIYLSFCEKYKVKKDTQHMDVAISFGLVEFNEQ